MDYGPPARPEHVGSESCPAPHAAYIASGRLGIEMGDGAQAEAGPSEVVVLEPGHDAWTVGDEPCVFIDFGESVRRAQPASMRPVDRPVFCPERVLEPALETPGLDDGRQAGQADGRACIA
jgi:hypothetical protein